MTAATAPLPTSAWRQYYALTKPRVVQLIVFCALIGMVLAVPGLPNPSELMLGLWACIGIWLVAGAAAAFNCLVEKTIDSKMKRTAWRPTAKGELSDRQALLFSGVLCALGSAVLYVLVNPLTMWLTFATFVGYAIVYTVILKPLTPQNIVIGGAAGAVPVLVGWAAVQNSLSWEPFILFIAIFLWTPPHFWALAIRHADEYKAAGVPMMPSVVPMKQTVRQMFIYTVLLAVTTLILGPVANLGLTYMISAVILGLGFIASTVDLGRHPSASRAMRVFGFSITYVTVLFTAMAVDVFVKHGL